MTTYNDYAAAAALAKAVESQLLERLDVVALKPKHILTIGFGTDSSELLLRTRYPNAVITRMDFTEQMLEQGWSLLAIKELPLAKNSIDLIISNLFLPWCADQEQLLVEWRRILRPEGLLMFTGFGPDTLREWHQDFLLPKRMDMHDLGDGLVSAGFSDPVLDVEQFILRYKDPEKLLHELQVTGMIFENPTDSFSNNITYEVVYAHTWGPPPVSMADEQGVVKVPLEQLGGRRGN